MSEQETTGQSAGGSRVVTSDAASFLVRSELMQNYATARPLGAAPHLASAVDRDGDVQLFSLGTDGDLYNTFPTEATENGWGVRRLGAPTEITSFAVATELSGTILLVACGSNGELYWTSDEPWSPWTALGKPFDDWTAHSVRAGAGRLGDAIFQTIAQTPAGDWYVARVFPRQADNPWDYVSRGIQGEIYDCLPGAAALDDGAYVSSADQVLNNTNVTFYQDHQIALRQAYASSTGDMTVLRGVRDSAGVTQLFMLSDTGGAFYFEPLEVADSPLGGDPTPGSALVPFDTSFTGESLTFAAIAAGRFGTDADGDDVLLDFFGISTAGALYHARQQLPVPEPDPVALPSDQTAAQDDAEDSAPRITWGPLTLVAEGLQASADALTVTRDAQGVSEVFAVGADGNLVQVWQDSTTDWHARPITLAFDGELVDIPSYSTEITVLDSSGNSMPGQALALSAAEFLDATVNGVPTRLGPTRQTGAQTNAAGRITVTTPTGTLGAIGFQVHSAVLEGDVLTILPDRYIQDTLYPDTAADLQQTLEQATYVDAGGITQPLIASQYDTYLPDASEAIWQSMSLAQTQDGDADATALRVSRRGDRGGVQVMSAGSFGDRIDPSKVDAQFWRLEFLPGGGMRYHRLDDYAHYQRVVAQMAAGELSAEGTWVRDPELFSLHVPKPDWGDLWHAVRRDAAQLGNIAVAAWNTVESAAGQVVDRIEATIQTVIDEVIQPIVSYVVDTVRQVFDLAEGVFQALAADFEALYRWLGSLFDWDAILATHDALAQILRGVIYTQIPNSLSTLNQTVDDFFDQFTTTGIDPGAAGDDSLGAAHQQALSQADQAPGPSSNWLQNQVLDSGGGNPAAVPDSETPDDTTPLENFEQAVVQELGDLFDTVVDQFKAALIEGQSAENLTANDILSLATQMIENDLLAACKAVTDIAFDLAEFVVESIGDAATTPWHIPLVSKVYKQMTGSELSLLDLASLVIAMPTSVAIRAAGLDVSSLQLAARNIDLLITHLTPEQLLGRKEIDDATRARLAEAGYDDSDGALEVASQALGFAYAASLVTLMPFSWLYAVDKIKNKWVKLLPAFFALVVLAFSFPLWTGLPSTSFDWITIGCWSLSFLLWFACGALPAVVAFRKQKPADPERAPLQPGNVPATNTALEWATSVFGLFGGLFLMGGFTAQTWVEGQSSDYLPDAPNRAEDLGLKWAQNILSSLPGTAQILSLHAFDEWGGKAWYGLAAVFGNGGSGACATIRDVINIDEGQVHHVI
ncbi:MAG: hypothetical protein AAGC60_07210 [Acidobacteriota bacterium]